MRIAAALGEGRGGSPSPAPPRGAGEAGWARAADARPAAPPLARSPPRLPWGRSGLVSVVTCDGRNIVGTLKGFDQATNVVLRSSHERIFSADEGATKIDLGLYFLRGDNM